MGIISKIFGTYSEREIKRIEPIVNKIESLRVNNNLKFIIEELKSGQFVSDGRIIPVPGSISADCGLAWCAKNESEDDLLSLMVQHNITPQGIYHCLV